MSKETEQVLNMLMEGKVTVEEATQLLDKLQQKATSTEPTSDSPSSLAPVVTIDTAGKTNRPSFLRVLIVDGDSEKVDIRVPLKLVRLGTTFGDFVPEPAKEAIQAQGIDLSNLANLSDDDFYEALGELRVDIVDDDTTVQIFCE